jgi:predicted O-linked N-acetylglucosamine transferase (SPINDLY family)
LENSFIPINKDEPLLRVAHRQEFGFTEDALIMAAFGNVYKINSEMFDVWCHILKRVDKAVLWLVDDNPATTRELKQQAKMRGIGEHQIMFSPRAALSEYRSRIKVADVFLDNYPYNCGSTAADVISCGVPIVTLYGRTMISRMGLSILSSLGLKELITSNVKDYEETVVHLLQDASLRERTKQQIQTQWSHMAKLTKANVASLERSLVQRLNELG